MRKLHTKPVIVALLLSVALIATSCGAGTMLQTIGSGGTVANVFSSVIGLDKISQKGLMGTWHYDGPGCAFTS